MKKQILALDCDGVILNYNQQFGIIYEKLFNKKLDIVNPLSYHAEDYFGIKLSESEKKEFYKYFMKDGWSNMQPFDNVKETIDELKKDFKIIIVTSMPSQAKEKRMNNLKKFEIHFDELYATGRSIKHSNPKKEILDELKPHYFVDDLLHNFKDIDSSIKRILLHNNLTNSPNHNHKDITYHSTYSNLHEFYINELKKDKKYKP